MTRRTARFRGTGFSGTGTLACALSLALGLTATSPAQSQQSQQSPQSSPAPPSKIHFEDITHAAGLHLTHNNAASGKKWLPETMGSGVAFFDYDNDGWQDILLVNGEDWPSPSPSSASKKHHSTLALYHNNHDGTFTDVTQRAGLAVEMMGMGVAIGDYDNDGFDDIFITALGQSRLFHNNGNGTFTDVTQKAGLAGPNEFSTAAAWVDYDRDGHLDLVVGNYVQWTPETDIYCTLDGKTKSYCTPESYKGASVRLWHNRGNGTFEDATQKAGLFDTSSKSLGLAILDANQDGWPDIFVSNDTQPNKLYMNNTNGTFTEKAVPSGVAYSEDGVARAGMGVAAADYDRSGYPSLIITNFSNQMLAFYHNERNGLFVDEAPHSEVGRASLLTLGFGCFFFDYDLDGWPDIYIANGHIEEAIERVQPRVKYAEPPHLFRNLGAGKFAEVTDAMGRAFAAPRVARGAAYGDINNDGALDVLVSTNGGPAALFKNTGATNHSLRIKLVGTKSNRDGLGATVRATYGANGAVVSTGRSALMGGETETKVLTSGGSYLSSSELILTFGLGAHTSVNEMIVHWPSGHTEDTIRNIPADQIITVKEGSGIVASAPLAKR